MPTTDQTGTSLRAALARTAASSADRLPPDVAAAFAGERQRAAAQGTDTAHAAVGAPMPDGELLDTAGAPTTLAAARGGRPAVVVFYRGAWCPYCNLTLRAYQEQLVPALEQRGATLVALSPQAPDGSLSSQEKNDLTFTVLSDPGNAVAGALGIVVRFGEEGRAANAKAGLDVAGANADGTDALPMPTVAVVDADGVLRWVDVRTDYTTRTDVADVLAAVDALGG